jgi:hypothetical protein
MEGARRERKQRQNTIASPIALPAVFALPHVKCYPDEGIASPEMLPGWRRGTIRYSEAWRQWNGDENDARSSDRAR